MEPQAMRAGRSGQFTRLVAKDLSLQWRNREALYVVGLFSLLVVLVFAFAYGPEFVPPGLGRAARHGELAKLGAAIFWSALAFGAVIALHRSGEADREFGAMGAIRLAGVSPTAIYFSRIVSIFIILTAIEAALLPAVIVFLQVESMTAMDVARMAGVAALGTCGVSTIGAFVSTMTASARGKESLLSVVLLPLVVPLLIAATKVSVDVFASRPISDWRWFSLLVAYPMLTAGVGLALFDSLLEE
ncbi:hypothetical protein CMK11_19660 [Candidatus Poribacteria bacterium]|nr:hypothetical protein [Candidatus Poribacteria bacterium]